MNRRHKWKREISFWDTFEVPLETPANEVFVWVMENAPDPEEHNYVLSTDGSGDKSGWGASAWIAERMDAGEDGIRVPGDPMVGMAATYGSTVQRREFSAFLDGLHAILQREIGLWDERMRDYPEERYESRNTRLTNNDRISVLWYTDRMNLAKALLYDEKGQVLHARSSERDLWMRYSAMAKYFCITPVATPRNTIDNQAICDSLCTVARLALKERMLEKLPVIFPDIPTETWTQPTPQKALF